MYCEQMRKEIMMSPCCSSENLEDQNRPTSAIYIANNSVQVLIPFLVMHSAPVCINYKYMSRSTDQAKGRSWQVMARVATSSMYNTVHVFWSHLVSPPQASDGCS